MTVWEWLVSNSTLAEADGDAWEHLTNPNYFIINSNVDKLKEEDQDQIKVVGDVDNIKAVEDFDRITQIDYIDNITDGDFKDDIIQEKEDVINEIC